MNAPFPDALDPRLLDALRTGATALGLPLTETQERQLLGYLDAMLDWNTRMNLTAVREPVEAVERHLLDSLSLVPAWRELAGDRGPERYLDLGTGGGFPGAPLAVAWPESRGLLIDGTGKKIHAVKDGLHSAGITNAEALQCRGHLLPAERPDSIRSFDLCVARAVGRAAKLLTEMAPLVKEGGFVLLMKGREPPADEIAEAKALAAQLGLSPLDTLPSGVPGRERGTILVYLADAVKPVVLPKKRKSRRERELERRRSGGRRR